jgi:hypothetical protein
MNPAPEPHRILQSFPAFSLLSPEAVAVLAVLFEEKTIPAGRDVFREGETGKYFYLLAGGAVSLWRRRGRGEKQTALLAPGDAFGEDFLSKQGVHTVTAYAEAECAVLRAPAGPLRDALTGHPDVQTALRAMIRSNRLLWSVQFPWLEPDERVFLATRKAQAVLAPDLALPILFVIASIAGAIYLSVHALAAIFFLVPAAGLLTALGLGIWQALDWSNDYYLLTNRRVIAIRRVPLIYDDRQEAPLGMVQSVSVSSNVTQRAFGFGNVTIRTFTRPIVFDSIPEPYAAARLLDAVCRQNRGRDAASDREEIERMIAQRIDTRAPVEKPPATGLPLEAETEAAPAEAAGSPPGRFETRFERDGTITYRKHVFFLVRNTFLPLLLVLFGANLAAILAVGTFPIGRAPGVAIGIAVAMAGIAWAIYEYADWANDLYQVTTDQILALHRRPLGDEDRRAAALENILSLEYDRPSILARLMNFGTVVATVGQVSFTFDEVRDPVHVQEDIFRRMESRKRAREDQQKRARREELSEWIGVYHEMTRGADDAPPEDVE